MTGHDLLDEATARIQVELAVRRLVVTVIGLMAIGIGTTMVVTGAPAFIEAWLSPWSRVSIGLASAGFGFLAVLGLIWDHLRLAWWGHIVGLVGLCGWHLGIGGAYVGLLINEGPQWANLGEPLPAEVSGRGYVPIVYAGLFFLTLIPLVSALKAGRPHQ